MLLNRGKLSFAGAAISGFDKRFKVISPWITVTANQYMNLGNMHERYFIRGIVNRTLSEDDLEEDQPDHFLMGISYRSKIFYWFFRSFYNTLKNCRGSKFAHPFEPNKPLKFWQLPSRVELKKTIEKLALEVIFREKKSIFCHFSRRRSRNLRNWNCTKILDRTTRPFFRHLFTHPTKAVGIQ